MYNNLTYSIEMIPESQKERDEALFVLQYGHKMKTGHVIKPGAAVTFDLSVRENPLDFLQMK